MELNDYFPANNVNVRLPEGNGINLPKNRAVSARVSNDVLNLKRLDQKLKRTRASLL